MKVLLLEDVKSLGKKGAVVEVKDGYGQNFLIAKNKAKLATHEVIKRHEAQERNKAAQLDLENAERKMLAKTLATLSITIAKKAGSQGALFGAITKNEIADALLEQHQISIEKKEIDCEPIKHLGDFSISINLGSGVHANLAVKVIEA